MFLAALVAVLAVGFTVTTGQASAADPVPFLCPIVGDGVINADSHNGENGVSVILPPLARRSCRGITRPEPTPTPTRTTPADLAILMRGPAATRTSRPSGQASNPGQHVSYGETVSHPLLRPDPSPGPGLGFPSNFRECSLFNSTQIPPWFIL